jgi:hypothetical protein
VDASFSFCLFLAEMGKSFLRCDDDDLSVCLLLLGDMLQGDASGPIGTRMVLSFSSSNKHRSSYDAHHDGDGDDRHHHQLVSADLLSRVELLLKEIVGGAALGWERHGPSVQQHQQQQQQQQRQQQQEDVGALKEIREVLLFETNWFFASSS